MDGITSKLLQLRCCGVILLYVLPPTLVQCNCDPIIFNFGDSNSDTGGAPPALGFVLPLPEGQGFFGHPAGRFSDGRLVIDFLCESLNTSYLSPFLESLGSDFRNGANFAIAGSATLPAEQLFSMQVQAGQFNHFKARSLELGGKGVEGMLNEADFRRAIYIIDIGQNDLSTAFTFIKSYDKVIEKIPSFIFEIRKAMETLYNNGARNFWVHGTGPLGCLPQKLALPRHDNKDIDSNGCLISYNKASVEFNVQLSRLCSEFNERWRDDAMVAYTDIFAIKYDLVENHKLYGFDKPLMACCGSGGPYNYNEKLVCANPKCPACPDGSKYISWDGVHYTEAANKIVAMKILSTKYTTPEYYKFGSFDRSYVK